MNGNYWRNLWISEKIERVTRLFSGVYYPTTNLVFYELSEINELFHTYQHDSLLEDIIALMEEKFNKYLKHFLTIFYFVTIMDPRIKFEGCKYLLENFYEKMNYPYCFLAWNDIELSINNMYDFYDSQFENKQSSQPTSSSRPKSFLLSCLLSV